MELIVRPGKTLFGEVGNHSSFALPGDKSISHRAAIFAAAAEGESHIENFLVSGVTQVMVDCLAKLGNTFELIGKRLIVNGRGIRRWQSSAEPLDCGNSATTMRLLAGAITASGISAILTGSEGLRHRPMRRIVDPLKQMGVPIECTEEGTAPLRLSRRIGNNLLPLEGYSLSVASAQVKTCLLLAGMSSPGKTVLYEPGLSRDHTERMLRRMGVPVHSNRVRRNGSEWYETRMELSQPFDFPTLYMRIPGDFSSAAFLLAAALITPGSNIIIKGVGLNPTRTGLLEVCQAMGGNIQVQNVRDEGGEPVGDLVVQHSHLKGVQVQGEMVVRMIDEFPIFAVVACFAEGMSSVSNAEELRNKESDRIGQLCRELNQLGAHVQETTDGFIIHGKGEIAGGVAESHRDHRLAMSLAVAGLACRSPVCIRDAEYFRESFPDFGEIFKHLGADFQWEGQ